MLFRKPTISSGFFYLMEIDMTQWTAAIVGTGRIGFTLGFDKKREQPASHTMALINNKQVKLIAAADTNKDNLLAWKSYVKNANVFDNAEKMLQETSPALVVIAVNEASHEDVALTVIKHKPRLIILEKPVALTVKSATSIQMSARAFGVPIMINHERRFALDYKIAREYMKNIGEVQWIKATLCSSMCVYKKDKELTGGYSLLHDGTHLIDMVYYFLEALDANVILQEPNITCTYLDNESNVRNLAVSYESSVCPQIEINISGRSKYFDFSLEVSGTLGRIRIGNGFMTLEKRAESHLYTGFFSLQNDNSIKIPKKTRYFSNMLQNAIDFLQGKAQLLSPIECGIKTLKALEDIKEKLALSL